MIVVRDADDTIVGFERQDDAERFLEDLSARMADFELGLHPEKTRLIEFGRKAIATRRARGLGKPETFDFLGFTHYCATRRSGGLKPRQNSTGGKTRLGRITKMGDRYLRKLLVIGACATLRHRKGHNDAMRLWASGMLERKTVKYKFKLTAVALANKVARIVFALMTRGGQYDDRPVTA